jgi:ribonuclease BN (tRNA processing enzyme)
MVAPSLVRCLTMAVTVTFAGCGDAFGSGGRSQACIHLREPSLDAPVLLDCGATSLTALRRCGLDPGQIGAVFLSHLHGDHFGGLPFLILDGQFSHRTVPLVVAGPPGTQDRLAQAMECLFPGSWQVRRKFDVSVTELSPERTASVVGIQVSIYPASHPSGAPALLLRLVIGGTVIAYTGDTAWTPAITEAAVGADLLIAEAYHWDKPVPHHLRYTDLVGHAREITARRVVLTHMSADMLARRHQASYQTAHDGLAITI